MSYSIALGYNSYLMIKHINDHMTYTPLTTPCTHIELYIGNTFIKFHLAKI